MTAPGRDLNRLLAEMTPVLDPKTYVFVTMPNGATAPAATPLMTFKEDEGLTLILREADAAGLHSDFACRRITLTVHSALDAVGFLAAVTACLTSAGISTNAVAAFHHDHLFVPAARANDALAALNKLSASAAAIGRTP